MLKRRNHLFDTKDFTEDQSMSDNPVFSNHEGRNDVCHEVTWDLWNILVFWNLQAPSPRTSRRCVLLLS